MTVREERAAAIRRRHRELGDDFTRTLPLLLDDLDAIDEAHAVPGPIRIDLDAKVTDAQLAGLRVRLDEVEGMPHVPFPLEDPPAPTEQAAAPAKSATRRRRT